MAKKSTHPLPGGRSARLPSLRLHRPSGRAVVSLGGRDVYLGAHGTPEAKRTYEAVVSEWLANGRTAPQAAGTCTVAELAAAYLNHADGYYRHPDGTPTTEPSIVRASLRPVLILYSALPAAEFSPRKLEAVRLRMIADRLARPTVNKYAGRIRRMFRWAVESELLPAAVFQALAAVSGLRAGRSAAREVPPVRPVADADVERTLPHLSNVVRALVEVQRLGAMRPAEVCLMTTGAIDRSSDVWTYRPIRHKTAWRGHCREIALGPKAQAIIAPLLRSDETDAPLFSPTAAMAEFRSKRAAARKTPSAHGNRKGSNRKLHPRKAPGALYSTRAYAATADILAQYRQVRKPSRE